MKFKALFQALLTMQQNRSVQYQIARHLSRVALYDWKEANVLYPDVKDKYLRLEIAMDGLGLPVKISEGFRTAKKQDEYYGRVPKITNVRGLESYHQYGLAIDIISKKWGWNAPSWFWNVLGREGKKVGFEWGGDWTSRDLAHFEWHPKFGWQELKKYFEVV